MGAESEREPVTLRQRATGLLVGAAAATTAGIVLGESWPAGLAIGAGVMAITLLISLSYARAPKARSRVKRNLWLVVHYLAEATSLWSECTGATPRIQLPSFGIASRRRGRSHSQDSDPPSRPPQL